MIKFKIAQFTCQRLAATGSCDFRYGQEASVVLGVLALLDANRHGLLGSGA